MNEAFARISERDPSILFSDCVDLFNCLRVSQSLGRNGQQLALKLDIVKCRLARWGKCGGSEAYLKIDDSDNIREILQGIVTSFQTCYKRSCRQSGKLDNNLREEDASMELDKSWQQLRDQLYNITKQSLSGVNLIDKTPWTIYCQEHAEILILDCVSYIEELENDTQFGAADMRNEATKDILEVNDIVPLRRLKNAAQDVDTFMEIVANDKYELLIQDGAIHIGRGSGGYRSSSQLRSGNNFVGSIESGSRGRIHVGDIYGGKGFWDD